MRGLRFALCRLCRIPRCRCCYLLEVARSAGEKGLDVVLSLLQNRSNFLSVTSYQAFQPSLLLIYFLLRHPVRRGRRWKLGSYSFDAEMCFQQ